MSDGSGSPTEDIEQAASPTVPAAAILFAAATASGLVDQAVLPVPSPPLGVGSGVGVGVGVGVGFGGGFGAGGAVGFAGGADVPGGGGFGAGGAVGFAGVGVGVGVFVVGFFVEGDGFDAAGEEGFGFGVGVFAGAGFFVEGGGFDAGSPSDGFGDGIAGAGLGDCDPEGEGVSLCFSVADAEALGGVDDVSLSDMPSTAPKLSPPKVRAAAEPMITGIRWFGRLRRPDTSRPLSVEQAYRV